MSKKNRETEITKSALKNYCPRIIREKEGALEHERE